MSSEKKLARGLRNCNPLNIKIGNDWKGERKVNTDGVFEQFISMEYGYRAGFYILFKYVRKYKRDTINAIIDSWAPDGEPYQSNYKAKVASVANIGVHDRVDAFDKDLMCAIARGMTMVENGTSDIDEIAISNGYDMAIKYWVQGT